MTSLVELGLSNAFASLLLAIVAVFVGLICRRPALTHALWLLVLLKLVTPPLVHVPVPWGAAPAGERVTASIVIEEPLLDVEEDDVAAPEAEEPFEDVAEVANVAPLPETAEAWTPSWPTILGSTWLVGAAAWFLLASVRLWRFGRLLRLGRPAPRALTRRVERLAYRLGMTTCPPVLLLPGRLAPMVWGVENPLLLLPEELPAQVEPEALDTLLLHELAHLRRRDHWVRLLEFVTLGLYWWLPVVWFARRELREVEEQCCDAWVIRTFPGAGRLYASAIVDALDFLSPAQPEPPLATGLGQVADLKRRLTMILRGSIPHQLGWTASLVVLVAAALLLPVVPSLAQDAPKIEFTRQREASADEIERLERDLKKKMEEIEALRRKMEETRRYKERDARRKAESAERDAHRKAEDARRKAEEAVRKAEIIIKDKLKDVEKKVQDTVKKRSGAIAELKDQVIRVQGGKGNVVIRIEISGLGEGVQDLLEKIQKVLPKSSKINLNIEERKPGTPRAVVVPRSGDSRREEKRIDVRPRVEPVKPAQPTPPAKVETPRGPGSDRRLDSLERRLESIMRELESLRREMRKSGGGGGAGAGRIIREGTSEGSAR